MADTSATVGRRTVQFVELVQPLCANTYGLAPCVATGPATAKCFNTRSTCQDPANFALSAGGLSLFFSRGKVAERDHPEIPYVFPYLLSVSTAPTQINLGGVDPNSTGLGNRAVVDLSFSDHPHTDQIVDPYLSGRTYDPYSRGTFWAKWMRRNKYRYNMICRVYEGYAGQTLAQMSVKTYVVTNASGPGEQGVVRIQAKDILSYIEERKATAPVASPGILYADITAGATSFEVEGATTADYPATGTLRIDDELMTYSARAASANGVTFTITTRGSDSTTAATHSLGTTVQSCVRYTAQTVDAIVPDLLTTYGGVPSAFIDTAMFTSEVTAYLSLYQLSAVISEPVAVGKLISELQEQVGFYIWWDERSALIKMRAIRGITTQPATITDSADILEKSYSVWDLPRMRISQLWFRYGLKNPVLELDGPPSNYLETKIQADLASEGAAQFGEKSIRRINSRWIQSGALARATSSRVIKRYRDVPRRCRFRLDAKNRDSLWVGDNVIINHRLEVDSFGARKLFIWTIISAHEVEPGHTVEYLAEDTTLYGKVTVIQANGTPSYVGDGTDNFFGAFIGNSEGLLSDGTPCARFS